MYTRLKHRLSRLCQLALLLGGVQVHAADLLPLADSLKPESNGLPPTFSKPVKISICLFDLQGKNGEFYDRARDLALIARRWNIIAEFKTFNDERMATDAFRNGQCEGAVISTLRARQFNLFMGSFDAVGALPTYEHVRLALRTLFDPKLEKFAISGPWQVVSVFPIGAQYLHVGNAANLNSLDKLAGKKIAVLDWDKVQGNVVEKLGGTAVAGDMGTFTRKFNSHESEAIIAPALLFKPYMLYKGLGDQGGIYRTPVNQLSASLLINRDLLQKKTHDLDERVAAFHAISAQFLDQMLDQFFGTIQHMEQEVPQQYWLTLDPAEEQKYQQRLQDIREQLTTAGAYDPRMMKVLKKVRCKIDPKLAECSQNSD